MRSKIRSVAVILPTFNERNIIESSVDSVSAFAVRNPDYHFLFVDDGSNDGTAEILDAAIKRHNRKNMSFLGNGQNRGKGYAVKTGFEQMKADALCFMDSDLAYSLDHLKLIVEQLRTSDVVIGSRKLSPERKNRPSLRRHILGESFNRLARVVLNLPFKDTQAGLKGFRLEAARRIFKKLDIMGFGFDVEVLFLARKFGLSVSEIFARENEKHSYKKGKLKLMRDSIIMFFNLLLIRTRNLLGRYD